MKTYLIHGVNLKPERMLELASYISGESEIIALPGHKGDSTKGITKESLLDYADRKIASDDVAVIGFSLGGLIATKLSMTRRFKKTCLIAPAIYPRALKFYLPLSRLIAKIPIPLISIAPSYYCQNRIVYPSLFNALFELAEDVYSSSANLQGSGKVFFHPKDRLVDTKRSEGWIRMNSSWHVEYLESSPCLFNHMLISKRSYKGFGNLVFKVRDFLDL